jgi:signal transduction histidine kinase
MVDAPLALLAFAGTIAMVAHGATRAAGIVAGVALAAMATLPLLGWRRAPVIAFAVMMVGSSALMGLGYPGGPPLGASIALYLIAMRRDGADAWSRPLAGLAVVLFAVHFGAYALGQDGEVSPLHIALAALVWAVAWFAGERTRMRRREVAELHERATRAERDADRERRLAVAEERARIARDLHDSAAHAVNVIAVQAGAARLHLAHDPARANTALETIEEVARRTVSEIDQIVHGLRDETPRGGSVEMSPSPPTLAALDSLVDQHRSTGLGVTVSTTGARRPLGASVDRAAYRILQEALTNSARHGAGPAKVKVSFGDRSLELTVANRAQPDAPAPSPERAGGGHGLVGMHERATLLGGQLEAGRRNGEFRVQARLPYGVGA